MPAARIGLDTEAVPLGPAFTQRTLALSNGSWQLLARICTLPEHAAITRIEVSLLGRAGRTRLSADDADVAALGRVVRYPALMASLQRQVADAGFAALASPLAAGGVTVHAEGDAAATTGREHYRLRDFNQAALIGEVELAHATPGMAFERFTSEGPLALLPLPEPERFALVWCSHPDMARQRAALAHDAFIQALAAVSSPAARPRRRIGSVAVLPLSRRLREHIVDGDQVWIGNAAQTLHPVAGQGFNLGLRDAFELARQLGSREFRGSQGQALAQHAAQPGDPQPPCARPYDRALSAFEQARRADRGSVVGITDALARLFTIGALQPLESIALAALDLNPPGRRLLARQMMYGRR